MESPRRKPFLAALVSAVLQISVFAGDDEHYMPKAKKLCHDMDSKISKQWNWDNYDVWSKEMAKFFSKEDFVYDFSSPDGPYVGIKNWWSGEHIPWNKAFPNTTFAGGTGFIEAGSDNYNTVITYAQATMEEDFKGIPCRHAVTGEKVNATIVDLDFYKVGTNADGDFRILYNACIADLYGMMVQSGRRLLNRFWINGYGGKKLYLPEGLYYPPRTMSGIPAPNSKYVDPEDTEKNLILFKQMLKNGTHGISPFTQDVVLYANPYGIGMARGELQVINTLDKLFHTPFETGKKGIDTSADNFVLVCEGPMCGVHGYWYAENQTGKWLGQMNKFGPHTPVRLRFSIHANFVGDRVKDMYLMFDIPQCMKQMGRDLFKELKNETGGKPKVAGIDYVKSEEINEFTFV